MKTNTYNSLTITDGEATYPVTEERTGNGLVEVSATVKGWTMYATGKIANYEKVKATLAKYAFNEDARGAALGSVVSVSDSDTFYARGIVERAKGLVTRVGINLGEEKDPIHFTMIRERPRA